MKRFIFQIVSVMIALYFFIPSIQAKDKVFTVVIDAGHGGKDVGAKGSVINEKVINLAVALKLGNLIASKHDDVKIVYTRKTDKFIELDERANIANRNKADLFISIHANAVKKGSHVTGTETFTMGLSKSDENLDVVKRENSVILLEDDYLQKYEGFDPNSSESYIMFEYLQNRHMSQSITFAADIQKAFTDAKRVDRGVKQGGLLVLRKTSMPAVLVELGFITNKEEEKFMKSTAGQNKLAAALYSAFANYKKEYDKRTVATSPEQPKPSKNEENAKTASTATTTTTGDTIYKVQILTSTEKLPANSKHFKGYKDVSFYKEGAVYSLSLKAFHLFD
ncbi:N-acetylmuramoyl-L-alanine amidase [Parabacteroides sp. PFB2-22]|uniref:N-acetylmuramoyl-L-alanine amidase family protein n=1 Tax=Parabacteroides sp. PFB2-22 TaxID=2940640 RepID=UPI0024753A4C|nr:N-acetylmuramoyl-L-alanine amidase [Parabacteroides sp. PFB2-22]MDH6395839.1 N-acetylmuramoyl-L-alanine amidase [Parabacteroides sp. PFB2-22]